MVRIYRLLIFDRLIFQPRDDATHFCFTQEEHSVKRLQGDAEERYIAPTVNKIWRYWVSNNMDRLLNGSRASCYWIEWRMRKSIEIYISKTILAHLFQFVKVITHKRILNILRFGRKVTSSFEQSGLSLDGSGTRAMFRKENVGISHRSATYKDWEKLGSEMEYGQVQY